MHTAAAPPDDVTRLLRAHGARPAAPVGTDGSWWVGRPVEDGGTWLEVLVADLPVDAGVAARAGLLTGLAHPHLPRVVAVEPLAPGRVALVCEHVPGPTLAAVRAARPPLSDGEVVTVAVPVAEALAALHAAGLAHGAVGADRVVLGPGGVPVLVDLRGALAGAGSPTGDVHRLVAALLGLMPSLDVHLASGLDEAARMRDALDELLRGPAGPEQVVQAVFAAATAEPVVVPDPGELAGADVALAAGRSGAPRTPQPSPRRARRVPRRRRWWPAAALVAAVLLVGGGVFVLRGQGPAGGPAASASAAGPDADARALLDRTDPVPAAQVLTRARVAALAEADAAAVAAVALEGSPAARADADLVERLAGARSEGLEVDVVAAAASGTPTGDEALVEVTHALSAHERVTVQGSRTSVPATEPRTVALVLRWTAEGWRVWDVREPDGATP